jgi:hypothetical protein
VIPQNAQLTAWPNDIPKGDTLSPEAKNFTSTIFGPRWPIRPLTVRSKLTPRPAEEAFHSVGWLHMLNGRTEQIEAKICAGVHSLGLYISRPGGEHSQWGNGYQTLVECSADSWIVPTNRVYTT